MDKTANIFIAHREHADYKLAVKLRYDRMIITPEDLFEQSNLTKIKYLLANNVLQLLQYNSNKHAGVNLLKSRLVHEIKRITTDKLYKKSCLVIQGYNNTKKIALLT